MTTGARRPDRVAREEIVMAILLRSSIYEAIDIDSIDRSARAAVLRATASPRSMFLFMQRYASWNGYAGPLVAELAGKIGQCREMFADPAESVPIYADRATEVAALVFYATIDEHRDHSLDVPHRTLAQATLKGIADFYRIDPDEQLRLSGCPSWLSGLVGETARGYAHMTSDVDQVVESLGFHIASEMLADREYRIIDEVLRAECPALTTYLKTTPKQVGGRHVPAYAWIEIHGVGDVEDDHASKAFTALDLAGSYLRGKSEDDMRRLSLRGYQRFASLQRTFFSQVELECSTAVGASA
jgi:hypothetical protein